MPTQLSVLPRLLTIVSIPLASLSVRAGVVHAQGFNGDQSQARALSRAGVNLISGDGIFSLRQNPAALARREGGRLELGLSVDASSVRRRSKLGDFTLRNQAAPVLRPHLGLSKSFGPLFLSVGYIESVDLSTHFLESGEALMDPGSYRAFRRQGSSLKIESREAWLGGAWRNTEWMSIGAALGVGRLNFEESRLHWASAKIQGRSPEANPEYDLDTRSETEGLLIQGSLGAVVAPDSVPYEFALASSFRIATEQKGISALTNVAHPGVALGAFDVNSSWTLEKNLTLRGGARYVGSALGLEASAAFSHPLDDSNASLTFDAFPKSDQANDDAIDSAPLTFQSLQTLSVGGAVDLLVFNDFLLLHAGYKWRRALSDRILASAVRYEEHTFGLGFDAQLQSVLLSLGAALSLAPDLERADIEVSSRTLRVGVSAETAF